MADFVDYMTKGNNSAVLPLKKTPKNTIIFLEYTDIRIH